MYKSKLETVKNSLEHVEEVREVVLAAGRKRLTTCDAEEDRTLSVFVEPVAVVPRKVKTIISCNR